MDIGDISKVASRKRLNVDAEKLREKVTRETAKIIKLKVAQDTAYWDLKEKLHQVEGNHERLQQNMVDVQMQHEALSGHYQDELRLRPETLNKMSSTREICDVLEEYSERLKETLSRCKSDQATLCEAYQRSGQLVRDIKLQQLQAAHTHHQLVERLEEKLKLTSEHQSQMVQYLTASKQQVDSELGDTKLKLAAAAASKDELLASVAELQRNLDLSQQELKKKEEAISSLQRDVKRLLHEFNLQATDMKNMLLKQEKELKEATEANEALKKALTNQEEFTKSISGQNNQLQEKISSLEEEQMSTLATLKDLEVNLQIASSTNENFQQDIGILNEKLEELEATIRSKEELLATANLDIQTLKDQIATLDTEKKDISSELAAATVQSEERAARIEELEATRKDLEMKLLDKENELTDQKDASEKQSEELNNAIQQKDKELHDKAGAISQLMSDVRAATDARHKLDAALQRARADHDADLAAADLRHSHYADTLEQLQLTLRGKDEELSKQMSIILETRSEKERLQEKIQSMQNMIDNIQKELTGRPPPPPAHLPELDDNANMFAPTNKKMSMPSSPKLPMPTDFVKPRSEPKQLDSMLFSIFSDGSMDGDTLDPSEVNRRFEALSRGERVAPLPLGSLKRRAGVPAAHARLKHKGLADGHISLSQVKNDLKNKEKTFFKNKRLDAKCKKPK